MSKVWFVTGASSGIGAGVVRAALDAGDRVIATARNVEKLRSAIGEQAGDRLAFVPLDVTKEEQARQAVAAAVEKFGRIDVLVNNAGYSLIGNLESLTPAQIEQQFATNFYGVLHVLRAVLPVMRRQRSGRVFNVSSMAGVIGYATVGAYAATKFAVEGLSLSVAQEVERFGITVTVVEPGFFRTDLLAPQSVVFGELAVEGYDAPAAVKEQWQGYHHNQSGDPAKLGKALVRLAGMETPPKQFFAGSDAVSGITADLEARLAEARAHKDLSVSTDGDFERPANDEQRESP
ncbi:SDR family NAD(P)-dependent oxidoreductase [Corallococcus exiguus]|uniref:SDR family NAD(P)-dependent oxidoreductase n=1 Tax=Corallococcus TaxID=83461 RepID=UPI000EDBE971|nr:MULTISPECIES: SDR family NAD(P)-dependent oxidoreductase [Corallococcus]NPC68827.1 SDR family NAD(P)-dependent oxidoreductase [Corallococcus exiguus]NRD44660.1 SDR family NAD(P)-dependent oxidoreductase [Corallococcus exiguus]RKI03814.1 SDR family NAD(P)-dependent oxidoreductase [Corallococcus sp. AB038B]